MLTSTVGALIKKRKMINFTLKTTFSTLLVFG